MEKTIASLATIPGRVGTLNKTVKSLIGQVDQINIFFNGFKKPEIDSSLLDYPVEFDLHCSPINIGDQGKFYWSYLEGYHVICDDDLIYPSDYAKKTIEAIERYSRKAVVSYHGRRFSKPPISNYFKDRKFFVHCLHDWKQDTQLHCPGTGVMAYHSDLLKPELSDFKEPNMADLWIGRLCQTNKIAIFGLAHKKGWIKHQDTPTTIYEIAIKSHNHITNLTNEIKWELHKI